MPQLVAWGAICHWERLFLYWRIDSHAHRVIVWLTLCECIEHGWCARMLRRFQLCTGPLVRRWRKWLTLHVSQSCLTISTFCMSLCGHLYKQNDSTEPWWLLDKRRNLFFSAQWHWVYGILFLVKFSNRFFTLLPSGVLAQCPSLFFFHTFLLLHLPHTLGLSRC